MGDTTANGARKPKVRVEGNTDRNTSGLGFGCNRHDEQNGDSNGEKEEERWSGSPPLL